MALDESFEFIERHLNDLKYEVDKLETKLELNQIKAKEIEELLSGIDLCDDVCSVCKEAENCISKIYILVREMLK